MDETKNNVIHIWEAKHTSDDKRNLEEFVKYAQEELTLYQDQGWEVDKWKTNKRQTLVFGFLDKGNNYSPVEKFEGPFLDFVKAFVRQQMTIKEVSSAHLWNATFRLLYQTLKEFNPTQEPCILQLDNVVIKSIVQRLKESDYASMSKYDIGGKLQNLINWLLDNKLILTLPNFKNPFKKPVHQAVQVGKKGDEFREERCPSMHEMLCLAECFSKAETVADKYFTSVLVMLCFAPARVNELCGLTINSLQQGDDGGWYVVWYGSKEFPDHRKGVPELMLDTVKKAVERLTVIGEPARAIAKWAYEHPNEFYRHDKCITRSEHGENEQITEREFAYAMNVSGSLHRTNKEKLNTATKWINSLLQEDDLSYRRLNQLVRDKYIKASWPNNSKSNRPIWENLLLTRDLETKPKSSLKGFSWVMPNVNTFNDQITKKNKSMSTLWERFDLVNEDGTPITLTTHQFRVWLNTHAKLGGVDDWKIAQWSGRADMNQNTAYDLRTLEEKKRIQTELMVYSYDETPNALVLRKANLPVPLRAIGIDREGIADFTGIGFCVHDFAQTPCTKAGECVSCKDHICLTGMPESLEELELLESEISPEFEYAKQESEDGTFGADRWVTHLGWKLAHVRTIIKHMKDGELLESAIIRFPIEHDPSNTRIALEEKGLITDLEGEENDANEEKISPSVSMRNLLGFN